MLTPETYCQRRGCSIPLPSDELVETILRNLYNNQLGDNRNMFNLEQFAYTFRSVTRNKYDRATKLTQASAKNIVTCIKTLT